MTSGKRFLSVDVDCVATGIRHDAREVCRVAVVDADENTLLSKKVKPEKPVVSYLTPLTGIREGDLDNGEKLLDVIAEVKSLLGPDVVLVGQGIKLDIKWLQLEQGTDFAEFVELAEMFKVHNRCYGTYRYFSLSHEANALIRRGFISEPHKAEIKAVASIRLYKKYKDDPRSLEQAKLQLESVRLPDSFAKSYNYRYEDVCMAVFYPTKCFCGAPTYS